MMMVKFKFTIMTPDPSLPTDSRRDFVKKSIAATVIVAQPTILAGLIQAAGGGGGPTTTTTTTAAFQVFGSEILSTGVFTFPSGVYWAKAKVVISSPNPFSSVTITIAPAGAECQAPPAPAPPELVGSPFTVTGAVTTSGVFSGTCSGGAAHVSKAAIAVAPGFPVGTSMVDACIRIDKVTPAVDSIVVEGVAWIEYPMPGGAVAKSAERQWKVKIEKKSISAPAPEPE
jgi:hypothetical protein